MKRQKQMQKAFGINEVGLVDFPVKISNVQVSRIVYGNERGCSWCFPHGWETSNSTMFVNRQAELEALQKNKMEADLKERPDRSGLHYYKPLNLDTTSGRYLVWRFVS